jgi:hypothetical protein
VILLTLLASACATDSTPETSGTSTRTSGSADQSAPSTAHPQPTTEIAANGPVFTSWKEVLPFASVTVEGSITRRVGTEKMPDDPAVEDIAWSMWELQVTDPLGADVPTTLTLVDFDRQSVNVVSESLPALEDGMTGLFALDTADSGSRVLFPSQGTTYYPVAILEKTPEGYVDVVGNLPTMSTLGEIMEHIEADNS